MERRTGHTPMDFEWANHSGLRDEASPWPKGDPKKSALAGKPTTDSDVPMKNAAPSTFGSRSSFGLGSWGRAFGTSNPSKPTTPPSTVTSAVEGYRENPAAAVAFSDTEAPSSPEHADYEATPEQTPEPPRPLPDTVTKFRGKSAQPSTKSSFASFTLPSSWRGASSKHRPAGGSAALMILRKTGAPPAKRKRPRFDADESILSTEYSGSDADDSPGPGAGQQRSLSAANYYPYNPKSTTQRQMPVQSAGIVPAFFTYIHAHPELPRILSSYAQTLLTYFLIALLCFLVWTSYRVLQSDVDLAVQEAASELVREVGRCAEEFRRNGCGAASGPPPALHTQCSDWDSCMNMDPLAVGRARVGARTFSNILNSFFEGMSWKFLATVGVLLVVIVGNGRALVPPFVGGGPGQSVQVSSAQSKGFGAYGGHFPPSTEFSDPFFAPRTPGRPRSPGKRASPNKGRSPTRRGVWMDEEPGEGMMMMGSPGRSPQRLGYI